MSIPSVETNKAHCELKHLGVAVRTETRYYTGPGGSITKDFCIYKLGH